MEPHWSAGIVIVTLAAALASCDDGGDGRRAHVTVAAPSAFGPPAPFVGTIVPSTIGFTSTPAFRCPTLPPFTSNVLLVVDQRRGSDMFIDQVGFRFFDRSGLPSPLDLTRADLTGMFGSTLVPQGTTRSFQFRSPFGCGFVSSPDFVLIDLRLVDRSGARHQTTSRAAIR